MMNIIIWLAVLQGISAVPHQYFILPKTSEKVPMGVAINIRKMVSDLSPEVKQEILETTSSNPRRHFNWNKKLTSVPSAFIISKDNKRYRIKLIKKGSKDKSRTRNRTTYKNISRILEKTNISPPSSQRSSSAEALKKHIITTSKNGYYSNNTLEKSSDSQKATRENIEVIDTDHEDNGTQKYRLRTNKSTTSTYKKQSQDTVDTQSSSLEETEQKTVLLISETLKMPPEDVPLFAEKYLNLNIDRKEDLDKLKSGYEDFIIMLKKNPNLNNPETYKELFIEEINKNKSSSLEKSIVNTPTSLHKTNTLKPDINTNEPEKPKLNLEPTSTFNEKDFSLPNGGVVKEKAKYTKLDTHENGTKVSVIKTTVSLNNVLNLPSYDANKNESRSSEIKETDSSNITTSDHESNINNLALTKILRQRPFDLTEDEYSKETPSENDNKNTKLIGYVKDYQKKDTRIYPNNAMTNTDKINQYNDGTPGKYLTFKEFDNNQSKLPYKIKEVTSEKTAKAALNVKVIDNDVTLKLLEGLMEIYPKSRSRLITTINNILKISRGNSEINVIIKGTLQTNLLSKFIGVTPLHDTENSLNANLRASYALFYKIPEIMAKVQRKYPKINENYLYLYLIRVLSKLYPGLELIANNMQAPTPASMTPTTKQIKYIKYKNRLIPLIQIQANDNIETDQEWTKNSPASYVLFYKIPVIMAEVKRQHPEIEENDLYQYLIKAFSKIYPDLELKAYNNQAPTPASMTPATKKIKYIKYKNRLIPLNQIQLNDEIATDREWSKKVTLHLTKQNIPGKYMVLNWKNQIPKDASQLPLAFKLKPKEHYTDEIDELQKVNWLKPWQQSENIFKPQFDANQYLVKITKSNKINLHPTYVTNDKYLAVPSEGPEKWVKWKNPLNIDNNNIFYSNLPHYILRQEENKPFTKYYFPFNPTPSPLQTYLVNDNQVKFVPVQSLMEKSYISHTHQNETDEEDIVNKINLPKVYSVNDDFYKKEQFSEKEIPSDSLTSFVSPEIKKERNKTHEIPSNEASKYKSVKPKITRENTDTEYTVKNETQIISETKGTEESSEQIKKIKISKESQIDEYVNSEPSETTHRPEINESFGDLVSAAPVIIKVSESINLESKQPRIPKVKHEDNISPEIPFDEQKTTLQTNKSCEEFQSISSDVTIPDKQKKPYKVLDTYESKKPYLVPEIQTSVKISEMNTTNTDESLTDTEIQKPHNIHELSNNPSTIVENIGDNSFVTSQSEKLNEIKEIQTDMKSPEIVLKMPDYNSPETDESDASNPLTVVKNLSNDSLVTSESVKPYKFQELQTHTKRPETMPENLDDNSPETNENYANNPLPVVKNLVDNTPKMNNSLVTSKIQEKQKDTKGHEIMSKSPKDNLHETDESDANSSLTVVGNLSDNTPKIDNSLVTSDSNKPYKIQDIQTKNPEIMVKRPDNNSPETDESDSNSPSIIVDKVNNNTQEIHEIQEIQTVFKSPETVLKVPGTLHTDESLVESENNEPSVIGIQRDTKSPEIIFENPDNRDTVESVNFSESQIPQIIQQIQKSVKSPQWSAPHTDERLVESENNEHSVIGIETDTRSPELVLENLENNNSEPDENIISYETIKSYINQQIQEEAVQKFEDEMLNVIKSEDSSVEPISHESDNKVPEYNSPETVESFVPSKLEPFLNQQIQVGVLKNLQNLSDETSKLIKIEENPIEPPTQESVEHHVPKKTTLTVENIDDYNPKPSDAIDSYISGKPYIIQKNRTVEPAKIINEQTTTTKIIESESFHSEPDANDSVKGFTFNVSTGFKISDNSGQDFSQEGDLEEPVTSKQVVLEDSYYVPPVEESQTKELVKESPKKLGLDSSQIESILGRPSANFKNHFLDLTADVLNSAIENLKKYLKDNFVKPDVILKIKSDVRADMRKIGYVEGTCPDAQLKNFVKKLADSIKENTEKYLQT